MTDIRRIGAFYSRGPHFGRVLARLREEYPEADITAHVPEGFPEAPVREHGARILYCGGAPPLRALPSLIRSLRAQRYDLFVVIFDSPKLRLLAAASGAKQRCCHTVDGRIFPLRTAFSRMLAGGIWRRLCGAIVYARIWCVVHFRPVKKDG
jgi:DNA-binding transcriptional LysR family regulator